MPSNSINSHFRRVKDIDLDSAGNLVFSHPYIPNFKPPVLAATDRRKHCARHPDAAFPIVAQFQRHLIVERNFAICKRLTPSRIAVAAPSLSIGARNSVDLDQADCSPNLIHNQSDCPTRAPT